jgi:murein L,D-transpeptidase YafK
MKMAPRKFCKLAALSLFTLAIAPLQAFSAEISRSSASTLADKVLVLKGERKLILLKGDQVLKTYTVGLGEHPMGPKITKGDSKTPEGSYILDRHNPHSQYHKSIHISYPNADDVARAKKLHRPTGGDLFIHGLPNNFDGPDQQYGDWTDGCIGLTNADIEDIWQRVPDGTPIEIKP